MKATTHILALAFFVLAAGLAPAQTSTTYDKVFTGDDLIGIAAGDQQSPRIAHSDDGALMVWTESRTKVGGTFAQSADDVFAARFDAAGQLLSPGPIVISQDGGDQRSPHVV
ncbi:MAG: hypothetical protein R3F34_04015 [Planctomycetota bacterium]